MPRPVVPVYKLEPGARITPKSFLTDEIVGRWTYAKESAQIGGGLVGGTAILEVAETSGISHSGGTWVRVLLPGRDPPASLKLSGEEYTLNFWSAD